MGYLGIVWLTPNQTLRGIVMEGVGTIVPTFVKNNTQI